MSALNRERPSEKATLARAAARLAELLDPGIRTVDLMLTTACNLHCGYCYQKGSSRAMAPEVLDKAIRRLLSSRLDRPRLTFYGGEPLLAAPLVRRALTRVRDWAPPGIEPDVRIVTNGTRLDEEMTRLLVSRNVFVTVSFDGVSPAQDDRSPDSFKPLDRLLIRLKRDHPKHFRSRVAVKTTLTSRNVPFLSASFRYFLRRGVRDVDVVPVLPDDAGWSHRKARELDRELAEVARLSLEEFRRSGEVPFRPFRGAAGESARGGATVCACGSRGLLFVDVDGTIAPCAALAPSTLWSHSRAIQRVAAALGGLHIKSPGLPAALVRREARARRLSFLTRRAKGPGPNASCSLCRAKSTCFVCPIAVACSGGSVPAFHCDVNRLFARHWAIFRKKANRLMTVGIDRGRQSR